MDDFREQHAVAVLDMHPIQIMIEDVGPFAPGFTTGAMFLGRHTAPRPDDPAGLPNLDRFGPAAIWGPPDAYDRRRALPDLITLHDQGGIGATALMRCIHGLFGRMSRDPHGIFASKGPPERIGGRARVQLDLRADCLVDGMRRKTILSLWFGCDEPPASWAEVVGGGGAWGADEWARIGFLADGRLAPGTDHIGEAILEAIHATEGMPHPFPEIGGAMSSPALRGQLALPMAMLFTERDVYGSVGYSPARALDRQECMRAAAAVVCSEEKLQAARAHLDPRSQGRALQWIPWEVWSGIGLEPSRQMPWEVSAAMALRSGAFLGGTKATLFLIDNFDMAIPAHDQYDALPILSRVSMDHFGSAVFVSSRSRRSLQDLRRSAGELGLTTTSIAMTVVERA